MEAKVISFQSYKRNKQRGALTHVQYGILLLSMLVVCCSLLSLIVVFAQTTAFIWMAILFIAGICWAIVIHVKKVYNILRHQPIHKHYEYLSFYPMIAATLTGIVTFCLLLSSHWFWSMFSLVSCLLTLYLYTRMSKLL